MLIDEVTTLCHRIINQCEYNKATSSYKDELTHCFKAFESVPVIYLLIKASSNLLQVLDLKLELSYLSSCIFTCNVT